MGGKKNFSATSRYFNERKPTVVQFAKHFNLNGRCFSRLSFGDAEPRTDVPTWEFAHRIRHRLPPNAILFPDTNFFSKPMGRIVWDAIFEKRVAITPMVRQEIQPWLDKPHYNRAARDLVFASLNSQQDVQQKLLVFDRSSSRSERVAFPELDRHYLDYGYEHYFNLLAIRRLIGLELAAELGVQPTLEFVAAELHRRFGDRGYLVSSEVFTKGMKANYLADEQMLVMAAITALCTGNETVILTWDTAIQEQFRKLWHLIVADYAGFWAGEFVFSSMDLSVIPELTNESGKENSIVPDKIKAFMVPMEDFRESILPASVSPVLSLCLTIGGEMRSGGAFKYLRMTPDAFCAENLMAEFLQHKVLNGGKNSSRFGDCDCFVTQGVPLPDGRPTQLIAILKPQMTQCCGMRVSTLDKHAALLTREIVCQDVMNRIIT